MVLFKIGRAVTFSSYLMSSVVMILNSLNLPNCPGKFELQSLPNMVGLCQQLRDYSVVAN
jgi:hypothetical protein